MARGEYNCKVTWSLLMADPDCPQVSVLVAANRPDRVRRERIGKSALTFSGSRRVIDLENAILLVPRLNQIRGCNRATLASHEVLREHGARV